jgi:hypothetical protein
MRATSSSRPNIALLIDLMSNAYQRDLIDGVLRATAERGANVWIFVGGQLRGQEFETSALLPSRLASRQRDDAMIGRTLLVNGQPLGNVFISYHAPNIAAYDALVAVIASALERARRA